MVAPSSDQCQETGLFGSFRWLRHLAIKVGKRPSPPSLGVGRQKRCHRIGVNSSAFGRKLTLFSAIPLSRFSLKMSRFLGVFPVGKMHSMRSFQRQVELRRLGNQLPVLGKANSLFKLVQCCVFCLFVNPIHSPL